MSAQIHAVLHALRRMTIRGAVTLAAVTVCGCDAPAQRPGSSAGSAAQSQPARMSAGPQSAGRGGLRDRPAPPGALEFAQQRTAMVDEQLAHPGDGREAIRSEAVLEAMRIVPRHAFVPRAFRNRAYADSPLPIGEDQTISQPYIVALMTQLLDLTDESKVLEIGTGSGYQAAVLAHLTPHVYTIEIVEPLARRAQEALREQGYHEIRCRTGDGYQGWPEAAPFDAIIVTCAADQVPAPLWDQLRPGGRIVIPLGPAMAVQELAVVRKTPDGRREEDRITPVRFVPMTGQRETSAASSRVTD